ncbi:hypothetical protein [Siminovitchia fortis]|nr:hypothetical protein [Siminovitchia fortis]WHY82671.1 hypothetical protein QNH23_04595 [Siminovitchia fortis]
MGYLPGNNYGCIQYELEVQRMIYEGGAIFQDYLLKEKKAEKNMEDERK